MEEKAGPLGMSDKAFEFTRQLFDTLWSAKGSQDLWHWMLFITIAVIVLGVIALLVFKAMVKVVEALVKLVEFYKSSGLPLWLNKDNKSRVRRRKQFSSVLDADLAYLAKAESWNDQYFTDLEAEVETEGGYYASTWDRLRRRRSSGLRKERSLIRAITSSTERAMQLVGEPGSGKSVALRHLAKQLAEHGRKSSDKNAIVPLYVNLREFDVAPGDDVTADAVRNFVLDNIRRGDADTSAFVRENWDNYRARGIWLFLFDSFDEIPAVLHAEAGSDAIRRYSSALRHFLDGMGECKGILASREFKGPEALPWKKLRILPLSGEKQDELISNSFLSPESMSLVRQHLADPDSSIGGTPLFLTLLCRYVREEKRAPTNDHDLLILHVERLARREPDYLRRQYDLTVAQLLEGAERLARLFAEDGTLSLAPTFDQIVSRLPAGQIPGKSIERLIAALVDCKIGRADVPNAAPGDRRFAFAHRRYQEALFVRYLAQHPEALQPRTLLLDPRWREYAVTLLQTHALGEMHELLETARGMLNESALRQIATIAQPPLPSRVTYFEWENEEAVALLELLQEGFWRRVKDVPAALAESVHAFLGPRWSHGDTRDRAEVIRLGGLLPQLILIGYLTEAFDSGTRTERAVAFRQATFVSRLPDSARQAVLETLSDHVLSAENRAARISTEALGARLPPGIGANYVVARCTRLRPYVQSANRLKFLFPVRTLATLIGVPAAFIEAPAPSTTVSLANGPSDQARFVHTSATFFGFGSPFLLLGPLWLSWATKRAEMPAMLAFVTFMLLALASVFYFSIVGRFLVRSRGAKVGLVDAPRWVREHAGDVVGMTGSLMLFGTVLLGVAWVLGYVADWLLHGRFDWKMLAIEHPTFFDRLRLGALTGLATFYAAGLILAIVTALYLQARRSRWRKHLSQLKTVGTSDVAILLQAPTSNRVIEWLSIDPALLTAVIDIRGFSSFVLEVAREGSLCRGASSCLRGNLDKNARMRLLRQTLEDRLEVAMANVASAD